MARVLIVDDDVAALAFSRQAVRAAGHEPVAVTNAADARAVLDGPSPPQLLLAAPGADAGEALALASRVASDAGRRTAVLLLGNADAATTLPRIPTPVVPATLAARIAEALAAPDPDDAAPRQPVPRPVAAAPKRAGPVIAAEAALRALFRRSQAQPPTAPAAAPPAAPATGAPPEAPPRPAAAFAGRLSDAPRTDAPRPPIDLAAVEALARTGDYFEVLGVARTASVVAIRDAAARLLSEVDARALADPREASRWQDVRQVVIDARDVLGDDALRARYAEAIAAAPSGEPGGARAGVANTDRS